MKNTKEVHMRQCLFLYYRWFFQNLEKGCIRTNMHTTVVHCNVRMKDRVLKNPLKMNLVFIKKQCYFFLPCARSTRLQTNFKVYWLEIAAFNPPCKKTDTFSQLFNTTAKMVRCLKRYKDKNYSQREKNILLKYACRLQTE